MAEHHFLFFTFYNRSILAHFKFITIFSLFTFHICITTYKLIHGCDTNKSNLAGTYILCENNISVVYLMMLLIASNPPYLLLQKSISLIASYLKILCIEELIHCGKNFSYHAIHVLMSQLPNAGSQPENFVGGSF